MYRLSQTCKPLSDNKDEGSPQRNEARPWAPKGDEKPSSTGQYFKFSSTTAVAKDSSVSSRSDRKTKLQEKKNESGGTVGCERVDPTTKRDFLKAGAHQDASVIIPVHDKASHPHGAFAVAGPVHRTLSPFNDMTGDEESASDREPAIDPAPPVKSSNVVAQVVSDEQQLREAFEMVENRVPHAEVIDDSRKRTRRRFLVVIILVAIGIVVGTSVGAMRKNRKSSSMNFKEPAPAGKWSLKTYDINSTCGYEPGWYSNVTILVQEDGKSLETIGIKEPSFRINGTFVNDQVTVGPGVFVGEENGNTSFTIFLTIKSNTFMEGREEWWWTDGDQWNCYNGTAVVKLNRFG